MPSATLAGCLVVVLALGGFVGAASAAGIGAASTVGTGTASAAADAGAANETTLAVADATVEPAENATVRLSLDRVPEGLAGFEITLALDATDAGTITGARYPDGYQPTTDPAIGDDGTTITLEAADLGSVVEPGATNVTLAFVSMAGGEDGTADLSATDVQVDADDGSEVDPAVDGGTLRVSSGGSASDGQSAAAGPQGADSVAAAGGAPGIATGTGVGVSLLAVVMGFVGLGLLVRRG